MDDNNVFKKLLRMEEGRAIKAEMQRNEFRQELSKAYDALRKARSMFKDVPHNEGRDLCAEAADRIAKLLKMGVDNA